MFDSGSTLNMITRSTAEIAGLTGPSQRLALTVCGGTRTEETKEKKVKFRLRSVFGGYQTGLIDAVTIRKIGKLPSVSINPNRDFAHLAKTRWTEVFPRAAGKEIQILLGEPYFSLLQKEKPIIVDKTLPFAVETYLGPCLCGALPSEDSDGGDGSYFVMQASLIDSDDQLSKALSRFHKSDDFETEQEKSKLTYEEQQADDLMAKITSYDKDARRWTTGALWNGKQHMLKDSNYGQCFAVMQSVEKTCRKLNKVAEFNQLYSLNPDNNFSIVVTDNVRQSSPTSPRYFHPTFVLVKESSQSSPLRLITNLKAKNKINNISFNEVLFTGKDMNCNLASMFLQVRQHPVLYIADIRQMFSQFLLALIDQPMFSYIWRGVNENNDPTILRHTRLPFGSRSSPFQSAYILKAHATLYKDEFPLAYHVIHNACYVDDLAFSGPSVHILRQTGEQLIALLARASMQLRKFQSNEPAVLAGVNPEHIASDKCCILGLPYQASTDSFTLDPVRIIRPSKKFETKRTCLSQIASIFDLTTHFQPWLLRARIFLQKIWLQKGDLHWDDPIEDEALLAEYMEFKREIPLLSQFILPRFLFGPHTTTILDLSVLEQTSSNCTYSASEHSDTFHASATHEEEVSGEFSPDIFDPDPGPRRLKTRQLRINFDFPREGFGIISELVPERHSSDRIAEDDAASDIESWHTANSETESWQSARPDLSDKRVRFREPLQIGRGFTHNKVDREIKGILKPCSDFINDSDDFADSPEQHFPAPSKEAAAAEQHNALNLASAFFSVPAAAAVSPKKATYDTLIEGGSLAVETAFEYSDKVEPGFLPLPGEYRCFSFCDASKFATAALTFVMYNHEGELICRNAYSKARVAPLKMLSAEEDPARPTIPRLELISCVQCCEVANFVARTFNIPRKHMYYFNDSAICIARLQNPPEKYSIFVCNRLKKIHEQSIIANWRWVPTQLNAADVLSRSCSLQELLQNQTWISGPSFLYSARLPVQPVRLAHEALSHDAELKSNAPITATVAIANVAANPLLIRLQQISKYRRLVRVVCVLLRWKYIAQNRLYSLSRLKPRKLYFPPDASYEDCKSEERPLSHYTTFDPLEYHAAETKLWLLVQQSDTLLSQTYQHLQTHSAIDKKSKLWKYDPFVDNGLLRSNTRVHLPHVSYNRSNPVLIPRQSWVGQLLVLQIHHDLMHAGPNHVTHVLHQGYRAIGGRKEIRAYLNKCIVCRNKKHVYYQPKMDNLKDYRLNSHKVFEATACDFWGPVYCKHGPCDAPKGTCPHEGVTKTYGLVFTCLSTRYCQIMVAEDTTTQTFLRLFNELCSRFSRPRYLVSDQASYFRSANTFLRKIYNEKFAKEQNLTWIFATANSAHSNGAVEKLNHIIKTKISTALRSSMLTHQGLQQLFFETQALVNGRPLAASLNGESVELVSPNLLVFGKEIEFFDDCRSTKNNVLDVKSDFVRQLRHRRILLNSIWKSFSRSYVEDMALRTRFKDDGSPRQAALGDIILYYHVGKKKKDKKLGAAETTSPRGHWLLGRITEVFPDAQGIVRKARFDLVGGLSYVRSTRHLAFLETKSDH